MYSYKEKIKAIKQLIKFDISYAATIRKLGYPNSKHTLKAWYRTYIKSGNRINKKTIWKKRISEEKKNIAIQYYFEHGENISRTCRKLGYPSRQTLRQWLYELAPNKKKHCNCGGSSIEYTQKDKEKATIAFEARQSSAEKVANKLGVSRQSLYY